MKKLGIILDSFSGINKEDIEKMGYYFVPQQVIIDEVARKCNEDIFQKDMLEVLSKHPIIKTSQPSMADLERVFDKASKENDHVIFLPIQKDISSTFSTASALAKNYENIIVIPNSLAGGAFIEVAKKAEKMYSEGKAIEDIYSMIVDYTSTVEPYVLPYSIQRLIESGRLTGAKKYILKIGALIPGLILTSEGFKSSGLPRRTFRGLVKNSLKKLVSKYGIDEDKYIWEITFSGEEEIKSLVKEEIQKIGIKNEIYTLISPLVSAHTGSGTGIIIYKKHDA